MFESYIDTAVGMSDEVLDGRLRQLELERRHRDAELIAVILVAEQRGVYGRDGHRAMNAYLRATFNWSNAEAKRWRDQARVVGAIDGLGAALASGRISTPQIIEFARAHSNIRIRDALDSLAPTLIRHAEELPFKDFQIVMQHAVQIADADGAEEADLEAVENRSATVVDVNGALFMKASGGDAMATAELIAILDRFVEREFAADVEARAAEQGDRTDGVPLARTDTQRRHDAIHAVFHAANKALDAELPIDHEPEPLVNVVSDGVTWAQMLTEYGLAPETNLAGMSVDPFTGLSDPSSLLAELVEHPERLLSRRCETSNGVALRPRHVLQAALAGHVRRVIVDADSRVVDLGRSSRLFTGAAREAALVLLRTCEHPGCTLTVGTCQVDHSIEWNELGATDQNNSGGRCGPHNREKHRKRWRVRRATNGRNYTIRDDGTIMLPVGCRPPIFPDDSESEGDSDDQPNRWERARLIPWAEFARSRPGLDGSDDLGWQCYEIDIAELAK